MSAATAPIHVLFAIPELDRGGPDRVLFELITALDPARVRASVLVTSRTGHYLEQLPARIMIHQVGGGRSLRGRYPALSALKVIREVAPDIAFATQRMVLTIGLVAGLLPKRTRLVLRQANDLSADFAELIKGSLVKHRLALFLLLGVLRRADLVICQSDAMKRDLRALLGPRARLEVVWNPIDLDKVDRALAGPPKVLVGQPALVSIGRLSAQKGFDLLIEAIAQLHSVHPQLHLTVFGDGEQHAALLALVRRRGLDSIVTLAGFTDEPLAAARAADLFVLASRYEGFPNAVLEALGCGTPVVVTDCPGANAEIVRPGRNGRLAERVDAPAMAAAIGEALAELASYDREAIRSDCRDRFSSERIVGRYNHLFDALVCGS